MDFCRSKIFCRRILNQARSLLVCPFVTVNGDLRYYSVHLFNDIWFFCFSFVVHRNFNDWSISIHFPSVWTIWANLDFHYFHLVFLFQKMRTIWMNMNFFSFNRFDNQNTHLRTSRAEQGRAEQSIWGFFIVTQPINFHHKNGNYVEKRAIEQRIFVFIFDIPPTLLTAS